VPLVEFRKVVSSWMLYAGWGLASGVLLAIACYLHPYVFAFAAIGAAWLSGLFALVSLIFARNRLPWAAAGAIPTAVSFAILGTYKWA
jgi:hypothetical protein